jgi:hypothetical protein
LWALRLGFSFEKRQKFSAQPQEKFGLREADTTIEYSEKAFSGERISGSRLTTHSAISHASLDIDSGKGGRSGLGKLTFPLPFFMGRFRNSATVFSHPNHSSMRFLFL